MLLYLRAPIVLLIGFAAQADSACPTIEPDGCSFCGNGMCVGAPDAMFTLSNGNTFTCLEAEVQTARGNWRCAATDLQDKSMCMCRSDSNPGGPTPGMRTPAPARSPSCPSIPTEGCAMCANGGCVQNPNGGVTLSNGNVLSCGDLETGTLGGQYRCSATDLLDLTSCQCGTGGNVPTGAGPTPAGPTPAGPTPGMGTPAPARSPSCPSIPTEGCAMCANGGCVQNPNGRVRLSNGNMLSCGELETGTLGGQYRCAATDTLDLTPCQCGTGGNVPTGPAPTPAGGTPAPARSPSCPSVPTTGCAMCANGECVQNPNGRVTLSNGNVLSCGDLETGTLGGQYRCAATDLLDLTSCQCGTGGSVPTGSGAGPTPARTPAPARTSGCPSIPAGGCEMCPPGECVQNDGDVMLDNGKLVTCSFLEDGTRNGFFNCAKTDTYDLTSCQCGSGSGIDVGGRLLRGGND